MPLYENVFIVRQDVAPQQVESLTERFSGIIRDAGGSVAKTEYWGLRNLTFRIKKNRKGHYVMLNIDAAPAAVAEMERNMGIEEDVLRHLTLRVEEFEEGPSAILRNKGSREDGGRRDRYDDGDRHGGDRHGGDRHGGERHERRDRDGERRDDERRPEAIGSNA